MKKITDKSRLVKKFMEHRDWVGTMEHAFLYRSRVWVAKKKQNARPSLIFPRYQAFSLKGDGSVPRIQLVNRVYIQLLALRVGFANIAGYATILLFIQSSGVDFVDFGIRSHMVRNWSLSIQSWNSRRILLAQ